ncbi:sugar ABC transporter substrate-binding protein [Microbispora sp. H10836]|uniref:sugar ABC transporter substrate-binding protein n=1 Tax=Microbispora sp. H10836 TaxID=2729106 RepID=UPI001472ABD1|nr:sugar ABC transporter substrate-binding protein [Microbispora sp. H10836]
MIIYKNLAGPAKHEEDAVKRFGLVAVPLACALALAACSAPDEGNSSAGTTGAQPVAAADKAMVDMAEAYVHEHVGEVAMPDPAGEDFTPVKGKKIGILSCGQEAPACQRMVNGATEGLKLLGYEVVMEDGKLTPSGWATAMSRLIQKKVDGIIKLAEPDNAMPQSMKEAADAGIPVVCAVCSNSGEDPIPNPTVANVDLDAKEQGRAQGWYAIAQTGGRAKLIVFKNQLVTAMRLRTEGMKEVLDQCEECEVLVEEEVTQAPGFEARLRSLVTAQLQKYPKGAVNVIAATSDSQSLGAIQAVQQAGRTADVKIVSSDCELASLDTIRKHGPQVMCNNSPLAWLGFAASDLMARVLAGQRPTQVFIPSKIVDADNNLPAEGQFVSDPDYVSFYKKQWGLVSAG